MNCPKCENPLRQLDPPRDKEWHCGTCSHTAYFICGICGELHGCGVVKDWKDCRLSDAGVLQTRNEAGIMSDGKSHQIFMLANEVIRQRRALKQVHQALKYHMEQQDDRYLIDAFNIAATGIDGSDRSENGWE